MGGGTWNEWLAASKPEDLETSHAFYGGAGGSSSDHAINVCGVVDPSSGSVKIQNQNFYGQSVTTTINWWAYIIEIID